MSVDPKGQSVQRDQILNLKSEISQIWANKIGVCCRAPNQTFADSDRLRAFAASKDALQDTGESIMTHRDRGFDPDPWQGYIELWGVMQAIAIQQDAILEMNYALTGEIPSAANKRLKPQMLKWLAVRDLRHLTTGHPNRKEQGEQHTVRVSLPRQQMTYARIEVAYSEPHAGHSQRPSTINLGSLLDDYDAEAALLFAHLPALLKSQIEDFERSTHSAKNAPRV